MEVKSANTFTTSQRPSNTQCMYIYKYHIFHFFFKQISISFLSLNDLGIFVGTSGMVLMKP